MSGLTKSEKDFWVSELKAEIDGKIEEHREDIEKCIEEAFDYGLKKHGADAEYKKALSLVSDVNKAYADYQVVLSRFKEHIGKVHEALNDLRYEEYVSPAYSRSEKVSVSYNAPGAGYGGTDKLRIDTRWQRNLAMVYVDEVMLKNNVTEPLRLKELKKKIERGIMLATSSAKLAEFLEEFAVANDMEL